MVFSCAPPTLIFKHTSFFELANLFTLRTPFSIFAPPICVLDLFRFTQSTSLFNAHTHIFLFLTPLPHFTYPSCLLHAPLVSDNSHPPMSLFLIFGACVYALLATPPTLLMHSTIVVVFFFYYLFFYYFFFLKRENENILNYIKLQKIEKSKKWKIFSFALLCLSGRPHRVTLIFKIPKNQK